MDRFKDFIAGFITSISNAPSIVRYGIAFFCGMVFMALFR